ncbi:P2X purinoceptor 7-like [Dermacentor albipictus]|uniref:P2X purinoceptor 7-like n=1 Tax=Dermacentor albipictus TaxID=60249 RepID=UPI0031FD6F81
MTYALPRSQRAARRHASFVLLVVCYACTWFAMSSPSSSSSSSFSSSSGDDFLHVGVAAVLDVANHFQFDPLESRDSDIAAGDGEDEPQQNLRIGHVQWCQCGHCRAMETQRESVCCTELDRVDALRGNEACITSHPTFVQACLNVHALEVAYYALMEDRPALVEALEIHRRYRYTAYRQFARWVWHRLGRGNRKVLPSCVVAAVRDAFPSEMYTGFKYPDY